MAKYLQAKNSTEVKKTNRATILNLLLQHQFVSRTKLAELTGLSSPTVTNIINEFLEAGIVKEGNPLEAEDHRVGRRRQLLELDPSARLVLAIHLGIPDSAIGLVDLKGQLVASEPIPAQLAETRSLANLMTIIQQAKTFMTTQAVSPEQLLGIGVGYPSFPGDKVPISEIFQKEFDVPIIVENNVLAMTLGEYVFGLNQSVLSMVFIYIGKGVGAGTIINGELWRGARGNAGHEIAHLQVTHQDILCRCGNKGCLETVAAQPAIATQVRELFPELADKDDFALVDHLIQVALAGQPAACALLNQVSQNLYPAVAALVNIVDPELIVIGGRLARARSILLESIHKMMLVRAKSGLWPVVELRPSTLGEKNCGLVGAAALILMNQFYAPKFTLPTSSLVLS